MKRRGLRWVSAAVGVTLQDLAQLYVGLARLGTTKSLREIMTAKDERDPMRLMDQAAAWQVGNVLIGTPPPENGVHNRIAFKTGTSYGYPRRLVGRLRRPHHHRRLGRTSRRRAGGGARRPHRRSPNPVRRLRSDRENSSRATKTAQGRAARQQC